MQTTEDRIMAKRKTRQPDKTPKQIAALTVTQLIGCNGLRGAYEISRHISKLIAEEIMRQAERHKDEWPKQIVRAVKKGQTLQSEPKSPPPPPEIPPIPA